MKFLLPLLGLVLLSVIASGTLAAEDEALVLKSKEIIMKMGGQLKEQLQQQMKLNGPKAAIQVCAELAPSLSSSLSRETGQVIRRVSLKARNPLDIPDVWEQQVLMNFDQQQKQGKDPASLVYSEKVTEGNQEYFRFMKAIPTEKVCLNCHGDDKTINAPVKDVLEILYPHDQATGYQEGMIRGAFSIKKPL
ncbi:MAG: DUF3365 domain-containing protein [SAR324 cluster bacterium]|nr:DUF3365 domain-containing protein [SAR324 cluster bacterium]